MRLPFLAEGPMLMAHEGDFKAENALMQVGRAMIKAAQVGAAKHVLEVADMRELVT